MDKAFPYKHLPHIDSPADLRKLRAEQLPEVCAELRRKIIEVLAVNPGHLGSSLGAVELTVALHYVFDTPDDLIVWDVGHQAYSHKILTGRRDRFDTNRQLGGLKPFPSPEESPYDTFACGHASNSISAALGMAVAHSLDERETRKPHTVAVIGDGSMSGGLAFEGMNNVSESPSDLLIVLNDNDMSIDRAVGGMKQYLQHLHTSRAYNKLRFGLARLLMRCGLLTPRRRAGLIRLSNALKSALWRSPNVFEGMNIRYFGPADGHDVVELVRILREIKEMRGPKLLHLHTQKGHGYAPAEAEATVWHAPGRFDVESGQILGTTGEKDTPPRFQDVFGETLVELARTDRRIVGVTPAMPTGSSVSLLMKALPGRAFDVGIAEGHAVTFSAGMAKEGLLPFCAIYSSFAQRAYDNIIHDAALLDLPVTLCLDRAGLVGQDGPTHHGAFDLAALRPVPNVTIASPYDECELRRLMYTAARREKGVFVIRYPRGSGRRTDWHCALEEIPVGTGRRIKDGDAPVCVLSLGPLGNTAADAIARYESLHPGVRVAHYDLRFLKPLDETLLRSIAEKHRCVITVEDGVRQGGMGSAVLEWAADQGLGVRIVRLGLPDNFVEHGTPEELYRLTGLDAESICRRLERETAAEAANPNP